MSNPLAEDLDYVLAQTDGLWDDLRGARVFLTGGTGFFGCWLLETLLAANDRLHLGATVDVLTRDRVAFATKAPHLAGDPALSLHAGDVRTFEIPGRTFSHVVHAATDTRPPRSYQDRLVVFDTIVNGTRRTLDFALRSGARRFLLTSTGAIYGRQPTDLTHLPEDYPGGPDPAAQASAGAEGKRVSEVLSAVYAEAGVAVTIARCFAFVGPYLPLDAQYAAGNFIRDALGGGPIRVTGDGTPFRSYLYAADLAIWLWTILLRGEPMRPYNVGSEEPIAIADLAEAVARQFTPAPSVVIEGAADSRRPAERYVPCTSRARTELGVRATMGFNEALTRTVAWHQRFTGTHVHN